MHRVESEQVSRNAVELGHIVLVKLNSIDSADSAARPEEIRLVVVVNEDLGVESAVPSVLNRTGILEQTKVCIRSERIVGYIYVVAVAGNVELAVVLYDIRCYRETNVNGMILPVQEVRRYPHCAASAAHIVLAAFFHNCYVSGSVAP